MLNDSKYVSEDLKQRVLSVVEETGFKPNMVARGLVNKKTKLIGVLIPRISNNFFSMLIEGIEVEAQKHGYNILLSTSYNQLQKELDFLNIFEERQLDGIIFSVTEFTDQHQAFFKKTKVPTTFIGQEVNQQQKFPYITVNNVAAAYDATKYLIDQQHEKIAIMAGPETDFATGVRRLEGYQQALQEAELPVHSTWQTNHYHTLENGYDAASFIMSQKEKPTAIFACSDQQALGAVNYLQEHGYRIPEDISVMGFDDIDLASLFQPKLTTIRQYPYDMGVLATKLIMDQLKVKKQSDIKNIAPYQLIIRESTR